MEGRHTGRRTSDGPRPGASAINQQAAVRCESVQPIALQTQGRIAHPAPGRRPCPPPPGWLGMPRPATNEARAAVTTTTGVAARPDGLVVPGRRRPRNRGRADLPVMPERVLDPAQPPAV